MDDQRVKVGVRLTQLLPFDDLVLHALLVVFGSAVKEKALSDASDWADTWYVSDFAFGDDAGQLAHAVEDGVEEAAVGGHDRADRCPIVVRLPVRSKILGVVNFGSLVGNPSATDRVQDDYP